MRFSILSLSVVLLVGSASVVTSQSATLGGWPQHSRARPMAPVVTPGPYAYQAPPSDAVVLFDGASLDRWVMDDSVRSPARWRLVDGAIEVVAGTGTLMTRDSVGDVQLHIEWMAPNPPRGRDQDRGNSGVFFGGGRYEVQVLDSYRSATYADGQAASLYGQVPPRVNASRPPGEWQVYDISYTRPRFAKNGRLLSPAVLTVWHNGVLVHDHQALVGPTADGSRPPFRVHEDRLPITLQDHGHPVRFRNIWVRPLEPNADETVQYVSPEGERYRALGENDAIRRARTALGGDYGNSAAVMALGVAQSGQRQFREAIGTFTRGLEGLQQRGGELRVLQQRVLQQRDLQQRGLQLRVEEAMLLRWRGHRYLSVREFAKANADLLRGLALDSTNYGILFHLGVLRFAEGRHAEAAAYFRRAQPVAPDGGERAASTDWLWMALMRSGRASEAAAMLAERIDQRPDPKPAPPGYAYVSRLKLYRGELSPDSLISPADTDPTSRATLSYGLGNWYLVRGDTTRARAAFRAAVQSGGWAGFGFIVAERELMR